MRISFQSDSIIPRRRENENERATLAFSPSRASSRNAEGESESDRILAARVMFLIEDLETENHEKFITRVTRHGEG